MMVSERQTNPYLAGMLISVLIAASVAAVAGHGAAEADTNGDQQVNVLDVQTVVAQVLRGTSSDERADVNGDGHIDILDLQRILSQAAQADSSEPELPEKPSPKSTLPSNRVFTPPLLLGYRLPCAFPEGSRRPDPRTARHEGFVAIPTQVERYLYELIPHAPPLGPGLRTATVLSETKTTTFC